MHTCTHQRTWPGWSDIDKVSVPVRRQLVDFEDRNVVDSGGFDWHSCLSRVDAGHGDGM